MVIQSPANGTLVDYDAPNAFDAVEISALTGFTLACFMGISFWNAAEIILVTCMNYRRLRNLYFWSILVSSVGVIICTLSQVINLWVVGRSNFVQATLGAIGWIPMVTGQSLVLYSRLHMLYIDQRILRLVLAMIIFHALTLHITAIVLVMGANSNNPGPFLFPYAVLEKLQVTVFFVQETILSGLYLWASRSFLRKHAVYLSDSRDNNARAVKRTLCSLITVNCLLILLDVSILVLEYLGLYIFQLSGKNFLYSVKLKIELGVLHQLKDFVSRTRIFGSSHIAREKARQQQRQREREHIEVQWEAALHRAFGTISRSLARTRSGDSVSVGTHRSQSRVITIRSYRSRASRASARREEPEFFNVEMVVSPGNMQKYAVAQDIGLKRVEESSGSSIYDGQVEKPAEQ